MKMNIEKNKVVSLSYELRLNDADGRVIETVTPASPMSFIFGTGNLLPKFEKNIDGLAIGDSFSFTLPCDEAYGQPREEALVDLPMEIFRVDGKVDESLLRIGNQIPMMDRDGNRLNGTVTEVQAEKVRMDFNHSLAGEALFFKGEVIDIRDATAEEIAHGHIHTRHGCGHNCGCEEPGEKKKNGEDCGC